VTALSFDTKILRACGDNVFISTRTSITRPELVSVGNHVAIDDFFVCTTALELDDHVHISNHVGVIGGKGGLLKMGCFTNISLGGRIVCGSDEFNGDGLIGFNIPEEYRDRTVLKPVVFEDFANIGASVTILPGVTLPEGVVIGACSLVRERDKLKPWTMYAGNPLREIRERPKERMLAHARAMGY